LPVTARATRLTAGTSADFFFDSPFWGADVLELVGDCDNRPQAASAGRYIPSHMDPAERWMYRVIALMIFALVVVLVAGHVPGGAG